jgi:hypothetical protein
MTTQLAHPYKDHPEPYKWVEEKIDDIDELFEW